MLLESSKNARGCWTDTDAIAALHLVSLSQLSGGGSDWEQPFTILCQWLHQTNLHLAENPSAAFRNMSHTSQHYVKATMVSVYNQFPGLPSVLTQRNSGLTSSPVCL